VSQDVVQLTGPNGFDQGRDDRRQLFLRRDRHSRLPPFELHRTTAESDRHEQVTSRIGPPPWPDFLLFRNDPLFTILFDRPLGGPDEVWVIQKGFLLLQSAYEFGPPDMDRIGSGLWQSRTYLKIA
jgi:hypothetical protein